MIFALLLLAGTFFLIGFGTGWDTGFERGVEITKDAVKEVCGDDPTTREG